MINNISHLFWIKYSNDKEKQSFNENSEKWCNNIWKYLHHKNFQIKLITKIYHNIVKKQSKWDHTIILELLSFSHQIFWA